MTKKEEKKYFGKEWRKMKAGLKSFLKEGEQEDLHRFRIQVKKLRAFLILLEEGAADEHKLKRNFKPIRKIFRRAGEIRNAFINQELGKSLKINQDEFMNSQLQLQLKSTKKFKSKKVRFLKELKETRQVLIKKIKPVSDLHIYLFYQDQLHQIAAFLANPKFNDQLHECRKQVKLLLYNFKPAHAALGSGLNEEYLEKVQIAIGDWHDQILILNLLSGYNSIIDKTNLQKDSSKLRKKIIALTKDFYNQATTTVELPLEQLS